MKFRIVAIYALVSFATIGAMEVLARAIDWTPVMSPTVGGDSLGLGRYYHATEGVGDLVRNQDGHWIIWFHRPYHVVTNSVGLRNVEEPRDGALRILALGDSQTFGPYMTNEDTWPARVEANLRRQSLDVQVFNAGIAGYSIGDKLALLREKILSFRPDLLLLGVFENDVNDLRKERGDLVQRPLAVDEGPVSQCREAPRAQFRAVCTCRAGIAVTRSEARPRRSARCGRGAAGVIACQR